VKNRKVVLQHYPEALPVADAMAVEEEDARAPDEGEIQVAVEYLSIDAWIGTTMSPGWLHTLMPEGGTVPAIGVGRVIASSSPDFNEGDAVTGSLSAQTVATVDAAGCTAVDLSRGSLSDYLGLLSVTTGLTALFGIRDVGQVKDGDTVVVSAAAGAVGSVVGQMARALGASRVIGIAGGPQKCSFLTGDMGFDAAIDYKSESVGERLGELAPEGVSVFFDNVGGEMLDEVLEHIQERARVVICGAISQYADNTDVYGPKKYLRLAERYARMEGYTAFHFADRYAEGRDDIAGWMEAGKLKIREQVEEGIEAFPAALEMLFTGGNTGKLLVKV
jgi:NADPH-dependent curcumin reductase CurA